MRLWLPRQAASVNSAKWRPLKPSEQFHLCRFAGKRGRRGEKKRFQVIGLQRRLNHGKATSQYFNEVVDPFNRQPLCLMVGPEQFLTGQQADKTSACCQTESTIPATEGVSPVLNTGPRIGPKRSLPQASFIGCFWIAVPHPKRESPL